MPLRSPSLAAASKLCLMILAWFVLLQPVFAQDTKVPVQATKPHSSLKSNETGDNLLCTPFGGCEPCPSDAMNQPFCRPFGNRRLVHCINSTLSLPPPPSNSNSKTPPNPNPPQSGSPPSHGSSVHPEGEILAWESCGRIVAKERGDFYEFLACNVAFAIVALAILFFRSRRMQLMQARQLAARIGLIRDDRGRATRI